LNNNKPQQSGSIKPPSLPWHATQPTEWVSSNDGGFINETKEK
jgi:hypothetical protein